MEGTLIGGTSVFDRRGFTLIELLIVVVIIGILAAIAIPKFRNTRDRAYIATIKADIRNLATAQESYLADFVTYTTNLAALSTNESEGVTLTIAAASGSGWSATGSHVRTGKTCAMYVGDAAAVAPADQAGAVKCTT